MSQRYLGKPELNVSWDRSFEMLFLSLFFGSRYPIGSVVRHVTNVFVEYLIWTERTAEYRWNQNISPDFPLGLPIPFLPSLLGLWPSSMKIFSQSRHMCQHQRLTTAWNSQGRFTEGDVGHWITLLFLCLLWPTLSLPRLTCLGLSGPIWAMSGAPIYCVFCEFSLFC